MMRRFNTPKKILMVALVMLLAVVSVHADIATIFTGNEQAGWGNRIDINLDVSNVSAGDKLVFTAVINDDDDITSAFHLLNGSWEQIKADIFFDHVVGETKTTEYVVTADKVEAIKNSGGLGVQGIGFNLTKVEYITSNTVTISAGENGSVSSTSVTSVANGTAVSATGNILTIGTAEITATADSGYEFDEWTGIPSSGKINENITISASFKAGSPSTPAHAWSYSTGTGTDTNKLIASCSGVSCSSSAHNVSLILSATSQDYSGVEYNGLAVKDTSNNSISDTTNNLWVKAGAGEVTVKYVGRDDTTYSESSTAPTKIGKYTAKLYSSSETPPTNIATTNFEITARTNGDHKIVTCADTNFEYTFYKDGSYVSNVAGDSSGTVTTALNFYNASGYTINYDPSNLGCTSDNGFSFTYTPADIPELLSGLGVSDGVGIKCQYYASNHKLTVTPITHVHNWSYSVDDNNKLVATCVCNGSTTGYGGCDYKNKTGNDRKVSLTLTSSSQTYSGSVITKSALFSGMNFSAFNTATGKTLSVSDIKLYAATDTSKATELTQVTAEGSYVADLTVEGKTATCSVTVSPSGSTYTIEISVDGATGLVTVVGDITSAVEGDEVKINFNFFGFHKDFCIERLGGAAVTGWNQTDTKQTDTLITYVIPAGYKVGSLSGDIGIDPQNGDITGALTISIVHIHHIWAYSKGADDKSFVATCTQEGACSIPDNKVTLGVGVKVE